MGNSKTTAKQSSKPAAEPTTNEQLVAQIKALTASLIEAQVAIESSDKDLWSYEVANARAALGKAQRWAQQIPADVEQRAVAVF